MNSILDDLDEATANLSTVIDAGLLSDLKESVAYALRGRPRDEYAAHPGLRANVDELGELLHLFTGMPLQLCRVAALNQLLPSNRSRTAMEVLREFADRILAEAARERATTIIARERRRHAS